MDKGKGIQYDVQETPNEDYQWFNFTASSNENNENMAIGSSLDSSAKLTRTPSENTENAFKIAGTSGHSKDLQDTTELTIESAPSNIVVPKKGDKYASVDEAINMYRNYARITGFGIRMGTENLDKDLNFHSRYIRCNRYGEHKSKKRTVADDQGMERQTRKSNHKVCGCTAGLTIHKDKESGMYKISHFESTHNHDLFPEHEDTSSNNSSRLSYMDKEFMMKVSTLNIGPTKAFNLKACLKGGYDKILASKNDFKNFWRDYTSIIGPRDARWLIEQMSIRKKTYTNFFFKYKKKGSVLDGLFWADDFAKENYSKFSDMISMDATYRRNRYNMIFVPFTGINHHNKSINVGAALLSDETIESYTWLLDTFLEAHGHAPNLFLTDQDPALNQAISRIFKGSTHRLCMWHVMQKMQGKISKEILYNTPFRTHIHKLVWSIHLEIPEFEEKWASMISQFKLQENKWLDDMYRIREKWIPAYFRHIPMCGLMKTTSRSESANSFFNVFTNDHSLLVNFMFNFDTAVTKQRYEQHEMDIASIRTKPEFISDKYHRYLELHAESIYTRAIFLKVQKEIKKARELCYQKTYVQTGNMQEIIIVFQNDNNDTRPEYRVTVNDSFTSVECTCHCFNNFGYLCCHVFHVLFNNDIHRIPENYISQRWKKGIIELTKSKLSTGCGVYDNETTTMVEEINTYFDRCVDKAVRDKKKLGELLSIFKALDIHLDGSTTASKQEHETRQFVEQMLGGEPDSEIEIENPPVIINKGGNRRTRMKSASEKAMATSKPRIRECKGCHQYANHDRRNCPINPSKKLKPLKKIRK